MSARLLAGPTAPAGVRSVVRWLVTFLGFPAGGLAAELVTGPVDGLGPAVAGGAVAGLVLGAVQWWGLRPCGLAALPWIGATTVGLASGLGVGAATVDYDDRPSTLAVQGLICGAAVGTAQAAVVRRRIGVRALGWPVLLGGAWAFGWVITSSVGVDVAAQYTVFGSSGAVVVTALTSGLPRALRRTGGQPS